MTTAPGFTQSALTISGRPTAAMRMSARRQMAGRSLEREWAMVTVALEFFETNRSAIGLPTIMLRPMTTASAPLVSMPETSQQFHAAGRGAGDEAGGVFEHELGDVFRVEAIDVLARIDARG